MPHVCPSTYTAAVFRPHRPLRRKLAISDAGVGAAFCKAALKGASLNVYINTKSMADRAYAEELNKKADAMLEKYTKIADETFDSVLGRLK